MGRWKVARRTERIGCNWKLTQIKTGGICWRIFFDERGGKNPKTGVTLPRKFNALLGKALRRYFFLCVDEVFIYMVNRFWQDARRR
jgi:hypothetical protein